jgi:hypothetical protein
VNIEEFVKWKDVGVDKLIISLVRLRKHNKTLAQFLFLKLLLFIPAFQESFGVPDMPIYPKRGKNKETLSTKLVKAILKCSERKAWDYARAFNLECEIEKFSNEYHKRLILAINSDVTRQNNEKVEDSHGGD